MSGKLDGAVRRGRGGEEKDWTRCLQSDIRAFGIVGGWKVATLEAELWVETVTESGRRFMTAWREEDVDAATHRQEKREATRLVKFISRHLLAYPTTSRGILHGRETNGDLRST